MANENELNELRQRIGRLPFGDQFRLLGWILADHARRCDEAVAAHKAAIAEMLAAQAELLEHERRQREANTTSFPPEAKREAG